MSDGRERSEWNRTAPVLVKLHNTHITNKDDAIKFEDVHPYFIVEQLKEQQKKLEEGPSEAQMAMLQRTIEGFNAG